MFFKCLQIWCTIFVIVYGFIFQLHIRCTGYEFPFYLCLAHKRQGVLKGVHCTNWPSFYSRKCNSHHLKRLAGERLLMEQAGQAGMCNSTCISYLMIGVCCEDIWAGGLCGHVKGPSRPWVHMAACTWNATRQFYSLLSLTLDVGLTPKKTQ